MDAKTLLIVLFIITFLLSTAGTDYVHRRQHGEWLRVFEASYWGISTRELGVFLVMVGIPFFALITGAARVDTFALGKDLTDPTAIAGFTFINWASGVGVSFVAVAFIQIVLWLSARTAPRGKSWGLGCLATRDAFYNEVHWVFYRATPALLLADPYWGAMIGTGLVLLEWVFQTDFSLLMETTEGREYLTLRLATLICSTFLYVTVQNLWLMIIADLFIQSAGSRIFSASPANQTKTGNHEA